MFSLANTSSFSGLLTSMWPSIDCLHSEHCPPQPLHVPSAVVEDNKPCQCRASKKDVHPKRPQTPMLCTNQAACSACRRQPRTKRQIHMVALKSKKTCLPVPRAGALYSIRPVKREAECLIKTMRSVISFGWALHQMLAFPKSARALQQIHRHCLLPCFAAAVACAGDCALGFCIVRQRRRS